MGIKLLNGIIQNFELLILLFDKLRSKLNVLFILIIAQYIFIGYLFILNYFKLENFKNELNIINNRIIELDSKISKLEKSTQKINGYIKDYKQYKSE